MIEISSSNDFLRLQRIALHAQGLLKNKTFGLGIKGAIKAIKHIGYVQIDSLCVIERAHHHIIYSRVPNYSPNMLDQLILDKNVFEYWTHAAALIPIEDFRFSLPLKNAIKSGQTIWYSHPDKKLMSEILKRIDIDGPLCSRDLDSKKTGSGKWWSYKPAKRALEQLYMQGDIMVSSRNGLEKNYDLTMRVLPESICTTPPQFSEFAEHILNQQLRCHGLVSFKSLTYLQKNAQLRTDIKALVMQKVSDQSLCEIKIPDGNLFFIQPDLFEQRTLTSNHKVSILSPFDNSLIQRNRLKTLFGYDFQIECYLPEAKRRYGYFCLPLLYRGEFIGRMDCKNHRAKRHFEIKALYLEKNISDEKELANHFSSALKAFCLFQNCHSISISATSSKVFNNMIRNLF